MPQPLHNEDEGTGLEGIMSAKVKRNRNHVPPSSGWATSTMHKQHASAMHVEQDHARGTKFIRTTLRRLEAATAGPRATAYNHNHNAKATTM